MASPNMLLALWVIQPPIQAVVAVVMYRRKLHKEFPAFFAYTVAQLALFCIQFPVYKWGHEDYFNIYWATTALNLILAFRIIHEIFLDIFKPYHALKDLGSALFKWAALIMVLLSIVLVSLSPSWGDPFGDSIMVVQRCVRVVQCGLVIFLLAFCGSLGVNWRRMSFGIALGFGFFSGIELLTSALYSGHRIHAPLAGLLSSEGYQGGILIWLFYSLANRPSQMVPVLVPQRWDEALMEIQPQSDSDSLIPMFEHMVDQALSKSNRTPA
jgi:hypothetical protein